MGYIQWGGNTFAMVVVCSILAGCVGAKKVEQQDPDDAFFARLPPVELSSDQIHSPAGDMTAHLPNGWVVMDISRLDDPQIFAVACNPEYTMSVIFTEVPVDQTLRAGFDREGMRGLTSASFQRRQRRSNNRAQRLGDIEQFAIGVRQFGAYAYSTDSAYTQTRVAVFYTNSHLYECAITHLTFSERPLPSTRTIRDVHQIILSSVEW